MSAAKPDLVLENQEDVRNVLQLRDRLAEVLAKPRKKTVRIEVSAVERIDASALQLLTAFKLALRQQQRALEWMGDSEAFQRAVRGLGLNEHLHVAVVSDAA